MRNPSLFVDDLPVRQVGTAEQMSFAVKQQCFCSLRALIDSDDILFIHIPIHPI